MATLSKAERLYKKKLIDALYENGKSIKTPAIICLYQFHQTQEESKIQALFTAPKRKFNRAHDRNRVKRLFKEAYRNQKELLYNEVNNKSYYLSLAFIFTGSQLPNLAYVNDKMAFITQKLITEIQAYEHPE
jgi:ribonuclease P protein component